jgi:hypothetical protein
MRGWAIVPTGICGKGSKVDNGYSMNILNSAIVSVIVGNVVSVFIS